MVVQVMVVWKKASFCKLSISYLHEGSDSEAE